MTTNEVRTKYLDFFKAKNHVILPSSNLIPENDPTTLFTSSGMQPMIGFLLGEKHPAGTRIVDSQKCFRTEDIEEVGDNRHTTFFEMLGNWSLGDYFKREQITWMFEFITSNLKLDPKRIYISVFRGNAEFSIPRDEEAVKLWQEQFKNVGIEAKALDFAEKSGMGDGRIFYYPDKKNWWSRAGVPANMPIGEPGGPDSEMFWDFGEHWQLHENSEWKDEPCHVNCDCGRFMEFGNNVFMAYVKKAEKDFEDLPNKNIDFGGGLERMTAAANDNPDMLLIDAFAPIRTVLERLSGKKYTENPEETKAFRIIMDHLRGAVMLIGDGASPSNKDQGYFTRRLLRRSIRFAHKLGIKGNFCAEIAQAVVDQYKEVYPYLLQKSDNIKEEMSREEEQFRKTLERGLKEFEHFITKAEGLDEGKGESIDGKAAFDLYQTYGFPMELIQELAKERNIKLGEDFEKLFKEELHKHQEISRAGADAKFKGGLADHSETTIKYHTATHLLHSALHKVLGNHIRQMGSNITPERLRFDFAHTGKMTPEEIKQVEDLVNAAIKRDYPVSFEEVSLEEAKKRNAFGFFEERYGERVKVYSVGDSLAKPDADPEAKTFSREICGGPHVPHTSVIGKFKITKEEAVSQGARRIKAIIE